MQSLEAFTPTEAQVVIYCRAARLRSSVEQRWLTWRQAAIQDLWSWPKRFSVQRYAAAWDRRVTRRGGLTFTRFRERIRQIAMEALSYLPEIIVVHDFPTLLQVAERLGSFVVVPVDDDDWFQPDIGARLAKLTTQPGTLMVVWPDLVWWCDFDKGTRFVERFGVQEVEGTRKAIGSNTYAITRRGFHELGRDKLKVVLDSHWKVPTFIPADRVERIDEYLSLEVKHVGCTSLLLTAQGDNYWWNRDVDQYEAPLWAREHCDKVRELHAELLTDMGGFFDVPGIIREIEQT